MTVQYNRDSFLLPNRKRHETGRHGSRRVCSGDAGRIRWNSRRGGLEETLRQGRTQWIGSRDSEKPNRNVSHVSSGAYGIVSAKSMMEPVRFLMSPFSTWWSCHRNSRRIQRGYSLRRFPFLFLFFVGISLRGGMTSQGFDMVQSFKPQQVTTKPARVLCSLAVNIVILVLSFGVRGRNALGISWGRNFWFSAPNV